MMLPSPAVFDSFSTMEVYGKVTRIVGLVIEGTCAVSSIGSLCEIHPLQGGEPIAAEIVGYGNDQAQLMPLGEVRGLGPGSLISVKSRLAAVKAGSGLLGPRHRRYGKPGRQRSPASPP